MLMGHDGQSTPKCTPLMTGMRYLYDGPNGETKCRQQCERILAYMGDAAWYSDPYFSSVRDDAGRWYVRIRHDNGSTVEPDEMATVCDVSYFIAHTLDRRQWATSEDSRVAYTDMVSLVTGQYLQLSRARERVPCPEFMSDEKEKEC
jgi:hypothetical protein